MPRWVFWVRLWLLGGLFSSAVLLNPTVLLNPADAAPARLVLGLAVVAAALFVVAVAGVPVLVPASTPGVRAFARRARTAARPRLLDPDAAGRPRSRAPSASPAAA
jgi:hypothetical protein